MKHYDIAPILRSLKSARTRRAMTQARLSELLEIPQSYISELEKGNRDPRLSTLVQWARVLDLELMPIPKELVLAVQQIIGSPEHESLTDSDSSAFKPLPEEI